MSPNPIYDLLCAIFEWDPLMWVDWADWMLDEAGL